MSAPPAHSRSCSEALSCSRSVVGMSVKRLRDMALDAASEQAVADAALASCSDGIV